MSEEKARDIIEQLGDRSVCGAATLERLGHRAWSRPNVAISARIYRQYRVPDPWDPQATRDEVPIGLGPVSLRLGEQRRQPAPHLKPKPVKKKKKGLADRSQHRPPRLPDPKPSKSKVAKASPQPKAGTPLAAKQEAEAARAAEIAARMREAEAARGPRPVRRVSRSEAAAAAERPAISVPVRPDLESPGPTGEEEKNGDVRARGRSDAGRFRMPRAAINQAPVVRTQKTPEKETQSDGASPTEPPPRTRVMPSVGGGSMDDLFGAAAHMGRVSLRPSSPEEEEDE